MQKGLDWMDERLCVLCRAHPMDAEWRPFCSKRCKLQDLGRWADGSYRIPGAPATEQQDDDDDVRQFDDH